MTTVRTQGIILVLLAAPAAFADMPGCGCDPADPRSMEASECGLSREAAAQPVDKPVFFLKDINPRKPNRWLAIPRVMRKGTYSLNELTAQERLELWTGAILKARELWGDQWALAYNGDEVRTQCQPHIHIGKLIQEGEPPAFVEVEGPAKIPLPAASEGVWIHPQGGKLHVHTGEPLTETVLLR